MEKEASEFTKRKLAKDGLHSSCRECTRKRTKKHYNENQSYYYEKARLRKMEIRKYIRKVKANAKCERCPENDYICLDFHHIDRNKDIEIAHISERGWSIERIDEELKKCIVLCANCHRKFHRQEMIDKGILPIEID